MSPAGDIGFPALPGGRSGRRRRGAARGRLSARETPLTSAACGICRCIVPWGYVQDLYRKVDDRRTGTALGDYAEPSGQRVSAFGLGGSIRWCENPMFRIAPLGSHRSTEWTLVSRSAGPYAGHGLTFSREGVTCGYRVRQVGLPPRVRSSAGSVEATRVGCGDPWCAAGGSGLALGGLPGRTDPDVEGSRLPGWRSGASTTPGSSGRIANGRLNADRLHAAGQGGTEEERHYRYRQVLAGTELAMTRTLAPALYRRGRSTGFPARFTRRLPSQEETRWREDSYVFGWWRRSA